MIAKAKLGKVDENELVNALQKYKRKMTRKNFEKIREKAGT